MKHPIYDTPPPTSDPAVRSSAMVRCWWQVMHSDGYTIGGEHESLEAAEYFRTKCVDKKRRSECRTVRYELHKIEAPNAAASDSDAVVWEKSRFKGGVKWVCWKMCAWVTYRKDQPLHIGLGQKYLGIWECSADEAKQKLEQMYRGHMAALNVESSHSHGERGGAGERKTT